MTRLYLGADPGAKGALAVVDGEGRYAGSLRLEGATDRVVYDWLTRQAVAVAFAVVEKPSGAGPGQGRQSMFVFGSSVGLLRGLLAGALYPVEWVAPGVWQRALGLGGHTGAMRAPKGASAEEKRRLAAARAKAKAVHKRGLKAKAEALFGGQVRVTSDLADALLLAEYARRLAAGRRPA